jgi:hypothetical protein
VTFADDAVRIIGPVAADLSLQLHGEPHAERATWIGPTLFLDVLFERREREVILQFGQPCGSEIPSPRLADRWFWLNELLSPRGLPDVPVRAEGEDVTRPLEAYAVALRSVGQELLTADVDTYVQLSVARREAEARAVHGR